MRSLEVERMYRDLATRLQDLPADRQAAFQEGLNDMHEHDEGPVSEALRKAIAKSKRTPCAIAREAGIDTAPLYRFLARTAQLKLASVDALFRVLSLEVRSAKRTASAESEDEMSRELTRMVNKAVSTTKRRTSKAG